MTFSRSKSVTCCSPPTPSQDESRGIAGRQVDLSGISFKSVNQGDSYSWESSQRVRVLVREFMLLSGRKETQRLGVQLAAAEGSTCSLPEPGGNSKLQGRSRPKHLVLIRHG